MDKTVNLNTIKHIGNFINRKQAIEIALLMIDKKQNKLIVSL